MNTFNETRKQMKNMTTAEILQISKQTKEFLFHLIYVCEKEEIKYKKFVNEAMRSKDECTISCSNIPKITKSIRKHLLLYLRTGKEKKAIDKLFKNLNLIIENELDSLVFPESEMDLLMEIEDTGALVKNEEVVRLKCEQLKLGYTYDHDLFKLIIEIRNELDTRLKS